MEDRLLIVLIPTDLPSHLLRCGLYCWSFPFSIIDFELFPEVYVFIFQIDWKFYEVNTKSNTLYSLYWPSGYILKLLTNISRVTEIKPRKQKSVICGFTAIKVT